ncbi:MAG: hypothetical protein ACHRHE_16875 [Tepidisphaerales bacterium]
MTLRADKAPKAWTPGRTVWMMENKAFWSRLAHWMIGSPPDLPLRKTANELAPLQRTETRRPLFLRPFGRRDAAIAGLQQGFSALSELMHSIRDNLERQGKRQDEMISYLAHLPELMHSLPESQRMQSEALRTIGQQIQQHNQHQGRLAEMMAKATQSYDDQRLVLENINGRVESVLEHDDRMAQNLRHVSSSMENIGRSGESGVHVLRQLQDSIQQRDQSVHDLVHRQHSRLTALSIAALTCSMVAMVMIVVVAVMLFRR